MLNITELENRHKKYKLKLYLPKLIASLTVVVIFIIFINLVFFTNMPKDNTIVVNTVKEKIYHSKKVNISTQQTDTIPVKKQKIKNLDTYIKTTYKLQLPVYENKDLNNKKVILYPSFSFLKKIQTKPSFIQKPIQVSKFEFYEEKEEEQEKENELKITHQNTYKDIEHVLKRFKNNNNPALSLFVAKKYYELGKYKESYNYALITNDINNKIDASWIIFTKSLVKLKEKEKAVKILSKYINQSHSAEAKVLLDNILSGKFNE